MNKNFGDLMGEYESKREAVKRFGSWDGLDSFVEGLISQLAPQVKKSNTTSPQQQFGFDDMGAVVPVNHE
jgi:hypothetical protein